LSKLPISIVHYGRYDPRTRIGGVETFARNLDRVFQSVEFMTPENLNVERVRKDHILVICDNQFVTDWPDSIPVIGFQHGVAAVKCKITKKRSDRARAARQAKAAERPNTLWVACAHWISNTFAHLHGNGASHVVYHQVDLERFDGERGDVDQSLILHDARSVHKGKKLVAYLQKQFPAWRFEPLDCKPAEVPERMRGAKAFLHLSRYEGNSIVCNEAMAMNLPCMFTTVGLMKDADGPDDVFRVDPDLAFGDAGALVAAFDGFTRTLETRTYTPRMWVMEHASPVVHLDAWRGVTESFAAMSGWKIGLDPRI
jgi:hypothetical protein